MEPEIVAPDEKLTFRHIEAYLVEGLQAPTDGAKQRYEEPLYPPFPLKENI
jgi:hypothetical protein